MSIINFRDIIVICDLMNCLIIWKKKVCSGIEIDYLLNSVHYKVRVRLFNATFNSFIGGGTGVPGENHRPVAGH